MENFRLVLDEDEGGVGIAELPDKGRGLVEMGELIRGMTGPDSLVLRMCFVSEVGLQALLLFVEVGAKSASCAESSKAVLTREIVLRVT